MKQIIILIAIIVAIAGTIIFDVATDHAQETLERTEWVNEYNLQGH